MTNKETWNRYAVIGEEILYNVAYQNAFGRHANFETFATAVSTLFRCITGDGWTDLMAECCYGLYSYGLYSYDVHSYGRRLDRSHG